MENHSINPKFNTENITNYNIKTNINTNFENPYKFTHENLKYNNDSLKKFNVQIQNNQQNHHQNNLHQNIHNKNFFDSNIGMTGAKILSTAIIADEINKYPKQFGSCMEDIRKEYGNMYSDITGLNARAYCAIKPFTDTVPGVSDFLKHGLDGQARLNHHIFKGNQENFSALTKMDNELTKVEKYTSDKTLYKITNDYFHNKHESKLDNHNFKIFDKDIHNNHNQINKIPDISTSFNDMLNEKFSPHNNCTSYGLFNKHHISNNDLMKPFHDINQIINHNTLIMNNQNHHENPFPLCKI
jgi:hypothetical protein